MLHIYIDTIPHADQRYPTVGDYWTARSATTASGQSGQSYLNTGVEAQIIKISEMGNIDYEFLVAIHEAIEQHLCHKHGVEEEAITQFDIQYEHDRPASNTQEPGNDTRAPYYHEHQFATSIEMQIAAALGVDWDTYDQAVNSL